MQCLTLGTTGLAAMLASSELAEIAQKGEYGTLLCSGHPSLAIQVEGPA
jgi:hypothetical protein